MSYGGRPDMVEPLTRLSSEEDTEWAALASADGEDDEYGDQDCVAVVAAIDSAALELAKKLSAHMLAAKSALAQKGQARQAHTQGVAGAEQRRLVGALVHERDCRAEVERQLLKARSVQANLADALHKARESGASRLQAFAVMNDWQQAKNALKREAHCERLAPAHARKRLLRKVLGGWRSASRSLRHARIDAFWEHSCVELREALQAHYEPQLAQMRHELQKARDDGAPACCRAFFVPPLCRALIRLSHVCVCARAAASAWQAKEDLGQELKAAFMRGVCQLNLETSTIVNDGEVPRALPPLPMRPEDLLANAQQGLERATGARR